MKSEVHSASPFFSALASLVTSVRPSVLLLPGQPSTPTISLSFVTNERPDTHDVFISMGFAQLPAELQIQIFGYLQSTDLKAVRGVSVKFCDHASVSLFRTVVACARYKAMQAFQNISLHPVYQTYVKEIIFDGSTYDPQLAKNEVTYQLAAEGFDDLRGMISWARHGKFKKYQRLYEDQVDMKEGHVLLQTVAKALQWMPNITSVVYSPGPLHIPVEKPLMRDILPRGVGNSDPALLLDGVHHLIGAFHLSQYGGVREFKVQPLIASSANKIGLEFSISAFNFPDPSYLEAGKYFFSRLQKIDLDLALHEKLIPSTPVKYRECLSNMAIMLSESKGLRDFSLHLSHWHPDPLRMFGTILQTTVIFPLLGLDARWPKLRSLHLEGIHAKEEEVKRLISRHKETLVFLKFSVCCLLSGKWSNIVDDIVYGTQINPFVLERVNELRVGSVDWTAMREEDEPWRWQYQGQVKVNVEGERYFDEPADRSVYAWRHHDTNES